MSRFGRVFGILCLLVVGVAAMPFLVFGVKNHAEVPQTLLYVLGIGAAVLFVDAVYRRFRRY
jgi:hypothetical protein